MHLNINIYKIQVRTNSGLAVFAERDAFMGVIKQPELIPGEILAKDFECWFSEVAAAEQVTQVAEAFHELCREVLAMRRKNKQSLLDRMLGGKSGGIRAYSRGKSDSALPKE